MADETAALSTTLTPFEGDEVTQSRIEIRKVGGGLQDALRFDPVELHKGEERWVALKVRVDSLRFDPIKDSDCWARVHIMNPVDDLISFLDDDSKLVRSVEKHINSRAERIRKARDEAAGLMRIPGVDDDEDGDGDNIVPFGHPAADDAPEDETWEKG